MSYVNGKDHGGAGALTPTHATGAITAPSQPQDTNASLMALSTREMETARFMPVMDIAQAIARRDLIVQATQQLMKRDVDYGKIAGTERDTLLQPGADKLCNLFGLVIQYTDELVEEDWTGERHEEEPFFYYRVRGRAYRGDFLIGEGVGSCNSWEAKYRWRNAERTCPNCAKANIRKSKEGGWYCWAKTGGCGATFPAGAQAIEAQQVGRKPNPDAADLPNTILKMAYKRAKIAVTINATSASEFFTQDMENFVDPADDRPPVQAATAPRRGPNAEQQRVVDEKLRAGAVNHADDATPGVASPAKPWRNTGEARVIFARLREELGEVAYLSALEAFSVKSFGEFRETRAAVQCYQRLLTMAEHARKAVA